MTPQFQKEWKVRTRNSHSFPSSAQASPPVMAPAFSGASLGITFVFCGYSCLKEEVYNQLGGQFLEVRHDNHTYLTMLSNTNNKSFCFFF